MNKTVKLIALVAFIVFASINSVQAQQKFGHVNFAQVYGLMPGQDSIKKVYETYAKGLQNQLATMQAELESKYTDYQANQATWSNIIRQTKEKEIQDMQIRLEDFNSQAQIDLRNKEDELTAPLIERARKAVEDVAKENGYTYVFNSTEGLLLYATPSDDIMSLVKKKLGLK
ncbi:MAG: OmpH family outer membrane protein [Bacteroidales bacterium]|jgi:outer membrane protein|nr:OmpH family outer membrane protein [Lentimicrobium sp.]HQF00554.1 OmpH family outer membrane protein [Bacteroidales bacterium]HQH13700.1 OmpH family outer membrane protein [Bacteroidales bacterium]